MRAKSATPTRMSSRLAAKAVEQVDEKQVKSGSPEKKEESKKSHSQHREFGGPVGTFLMMFFLPATLYYVNMACEKGNCSIRNIHNCPKTWSAFFDAQAARIFIGWFLFQAVLYMMPVGRVVQGLPVIIGHHQRLSYRCNGFFAYVVSLLSFGAAVYFKVPVTIVYDKFLQLLTTAITFSFVLAVFLYIKARLGPAKNLSPAGNTGNMIYDFFMGHELNPRIGSFDFKYFCEMRPGLIGWVMINLVFLVKDYQQDGIINYNLATVVFFQALYVADALWFEDAILSTMDIIYEGFGFMLSFGDLAWVPFLYCLQGRYLLENPRPIPYYCLFGIVFLNFVGYFIFRGSNSQKNEFRKNPQNPALAHLETLSTGTRKKLLVSGWWGVCRKPNYLGDIIMAVAWSLPCGFNAILPYFYPMYFFILLVHRERRDDALCRKKYGASWDRYCEKVKYRIIPYVY